MISISTMDRKEIIFWRNKYDLEEDLYNKNTEDELLQKFRQNLYVTKENLEEMIRWKFQGRPMF